MAYDRQDNFYGVVYYRRDLRGTRDTWGPRVKSGAYPSTPPVRC